MLPPKNRKILVNVSYPVSGTFGINPERDERIEQLAGEANGRRSGSGSGFGQRDIDFVFEHEAAAEQFRQAVEAVDPNVTAS